MSKQNTEKVLLDFLTNKDPQVVALKWSWWSWKTYFWNNFLRENKNEKKCQFKKYSYCSLFWLKSWEDIRKTIYQNGVNREEIWRDIVFSFKKIKNPQSWFKFGKWLDKFVEKTPVIKDYNPINLIFQTVGSLGFLNPQEYLVCIDDFERASDVIDPKEILWIISELKEQRGCKVLFIFNDSGLSEGSDKIYKEFKEKVIDIEISFSPTPQECADVIFTEKNDTNSADRLLYSLCVDLKITNIRILKKIKDITGIIFPYLVTYDAWLREQVLLSLCLFTYSYYWNSEEDVNSEIPSLSYIKNFSPYWDLWQEKKIEHEQKWKSTLSRLWLSGIDNLDIEILNIIQRWYVIEDNLKIIADEHDKWFRHWNVEKLYSDIWRNIFHLGFVDNEQEFVEKLIKLFEESAQYLDISRLNQVIIILKELNRADEAKKIIDFYIEKNKENKEKFNIDSNHFGNPIDEEIANKFVTIYNNLRWTSSLKQTLDEILARNGSFWRAEEEVIFGATEEEIYDLFNGLTGELLHDYMRILLRYKDSPSNPPSQWYLVAQKSSNALKRFWVTRINKRRLQSYWISIEE